MADPTLDVIPNRAHPLDGLSHWVFEIPVEVPAAWIHRTRATAAHGDDDIRGADRLIGQRLRELAGEGDADLVQHGHHGVAHLTRRFGTRRANHHPLPGELPEDSCSKLRATGVLHADEEDCGHSMALCCGSAQ